MKDAYRYISQDMPFLNAKNECQLEHCNAVYKNETQNTKFPSFTNFLHLPSYIVLHTICLSTNP